MVGIIVTGHGHFATGMTSAAELIAGPQQDFVAIDFTSLSGTDQLGLDMTAAFDQLAGCDGVLVLCDLVGGSPFKTAAMLGIPRGNVRVVAGFNLGMLVETCMQRDGMTLDELTEQAIETGKASVLEFTLDEPAEEEDDFSDGI